MNRRDSLQTPALYAQTILKALVLLSGSSLITPSKIPAKIASTTSSPNEQTRKETLARRFRASISSLSWDFRL